VSNWVCLLNATYFLKLPIIEELALGLRPNSPLHQQLHASSIVSPTHQQWAELLLPSTSPNLITRTTLKNRPHTCTLPKCFPHLPSCCSQHCFFYISLIGPEPNSSRSLRDKHQRMRSSLIPSR